MNFVSKKLGNWNNYPLVESEIYTPYFYDQFSDILMPGFKGIARGNGRCYGDASLGKTVINMLSLKNVINFDISNGILTCQSGMLLSEILEIIVPRGWFLPVTPGTKFITVGGAVASDVHGKNHHKEGSFADHVINIKLIMPDGSVKQCSPQENTALFEYTAGGMGLTGVIIEVTFKLKKIESSYISQKQIKAANLNEVIELFDLYNDYTYSVAWIDCVKKGKNFGRSILMLGEHANASEGRDLKIPGKFKFTVPFNFPSITLNKYSVGLFNNVFYAKNYKKTLDSIVPYEKFFYPLDSILEWNRIYGKRGFIQYQFVVPRENGKEALTEILKRITNEGVGSFLAVLKAFGSKGGPISFQMNGYTLALDIPITGTLFKFLELLDSIVINYGGRLYLSKDARMSSDMFYKSYSNSYKFAQYVSEIDPNRVFVSDLSRRLKIK